MILAVLAILWFAIIIVASINFILQRQINERTRNLKRSREPGGSKP